MDEVQIRPLRESDYGAVLEILSGGYQTRDGKSLDWSLRDSPIFCRDFSAIAEIDGRPVGVWLSSVQDLKVAEGMYIPASSGLIVVHPEFRRKGIGTCLWRWRRKTGAERRDGPLLGYGVSSEETRKLFWKRLSAAPTLPDSGRVYSKLISLEPIKRAVREVQDARGDAEPLESESVNVAFQLQGVPPFILRISPRALALVEGLEADMKVRISNGIPGGFGLVGSILRRRVRISGWRHLLRLFRSRRILGEFAAAIRLGG